MGVLPVISSARRDSRLEVYHRFPEVLDFYLQYHNIEGHTDATVRFYRTEIGLFIRWLEEQGHSLDLGELTSLHVLGHLESLKRLGRAPRTVRSRLQAIKTMLRWAVEWDILQVNPADRSGHLRSPRSASLSSRKTPFNNCWTICPLNTLLGARRQSMMWFLATSGVRRRELMLLNLEDLDWTRAKSGYATGRVKRSARCLSCVKPSFRCSATSSSGPMTIRVSG